MGAVLRFRRPTHSSQLSRRKLASNCARPAAALRDMFALHGKDLDVADQAEAQDYDGLPKLLRRYLDADKKY